MVRQLHFSVAVSLADQNVCTLRWIGFGCVVIGAIGDFLALGLAMQSLVTALGGATTLTANVVIARYWLKVRSQAYKSHAIESPPDTNLLQETLSRNDIIGVALIIIGAVGIASISPPSQNYKLYQLQNLVEGYIFAANSIDLITSQYMYV